MKFFYKKKKICGLIAICFVVMLSFQIVSTTTLNDPENVNIDENPKISATITGTKQWLNNTGFNTTDYWNKETNTDESFPDVNGTIDIDNELANFTVLGDIDTKMIDAPLNDGSWYKFENGIFRLPTQSYIDSRGCFVYHDWDENVDQTHNFPSVQWKKNVSMGFDMSEYNITSASLEVMFNASVFSSVDAPGDTASGGSGGWQSSIFDFAEFYVEISDVEGTFPSKVAYNRTRNLGFTYLSIEEKPIERLGSEAELIAALNGAFESDPNHSNFNITLGINIYCEDNDPSIDVDEWEALIIRSCNLTFTYEKLIDDFTSISWNQNGNNVSSLSPYPIVATRANLKFQYKIDKNWSVYTTKKNSELNIYLNDNPYPIPIKLIDINDTAFEEIDIDLTPPASDAGVNLSIEVLIKDEFGLDQPIIISIDNVTLDISYTIYDIPDPIVAGGGGGGGGRTIIRGEDYTPVVIGLVAGIIGLVAVFGAYQKHFKYPPLVRKIRKLKKKIKKGKTLKSLIVNPREEIIRDNFKLKTRHVLDEEFLQSEVSGKIAKTPKNGKIKKINEKGGK